MEICNGYAMEKQITISIAAYNKEKYLDRCVQSLIIPSLDKVEIIIVNDGSTDRTSEIAHRYAERYPRSVRVIDKENGHQGSCVNVALRQAEGKYFKMLDADDAFDKVVFEHLIELIERCDADMIVSGHAIQSRPVRIISPKGMKAGMSFPLNRIDFMEMGMRDCIGMHGTAYKTEIFRQHHIRLTEHCSFTDAEYCYYPIWHCRTVMFLDEVLYLYSTGVCGQESSIVSCKKLEDALKITSSFLKCYKEHENVSGTLRKNAGIVLERCVDVYLGMYLLHFKTNLAENKKVERVLYEVRSYAPQMYERVCGMTSRKIPFVAIYNKFRKTSYYPYKLLNSLYALLNRWKGFAEAI